MTATLSLLVLRCDDIEKSRRFYEALGLHLVREKHGRGPEHFSTSLGATVLELYPSRKQTTAGARLGLRTAISTSNLEQAIAAGGRLLSPTTIDLVFDRVVLEAPDGHKVDVEIEEPL